MKKNYIFSSLLIILIFLSVASCLRIQEKPVITAGLSPDKTTTDQVTTAALTDKTRTTGSEETTKNAEIDLKMLKGLENSFVVTDAFPGKSFKKPLELQNAGDGSGRIFIAEQGGKIFVINNQKDSKSELFIDLSGRIDDSGNEKGLLGLAFHPDFKNNGQFFINYTARDSTVVARYSTAKENPDMADPESEEIIITFKQPYPNHNGGKVAFGPGDGYLYIGTGDGGGAGDPQKNGQDLKTLLGKILRIDVDSKDNGLGYSIPPDNPFKGNKEGYREEIYAYGLRNPWRFSFDPITEKLWAADVGQDKIEEINIIQKGKNYGWNIMEGSYCYEPPSGCDAEGLELPLYEYQHPLGESVTGGYVYHGKTLFLLQDLYIYGDFVTGYIWGLAYIEGQGVWNFTLAKTSLNISSFGIDEDQNLYFTAFDGKIYNLVLP